jgi:monoamine oxidase
VHGDKGEWRARRVVCAIPPVLAQRIDWRPALPAARDQLMQRTPMGATVKCVALYSRAFWREAGMAGEAVSTRGPVTAVFDNGPRDGTTPSLLAFVVGRAARGWAAFSEEERRRTVLDAFARYFGPQAGQPVGYVEKDWQTEVWTRGCPVGATAPGALAAFGHILREPVGRVHWAGTETATEWTGYMEGAVQSGERVSREVLSGL